MDRQKVQYKSVYSIWIAFQSDGDFDSLSTKKLKLRRHFESTLTANQSEQQFKE